ncbi:MAG: radical SAM protein [Thermoanaerobaculum sp.]
MKLSRYNFIFATDNGRALAYNALSNGLAVVGEDVAELFENFSVERFYALDSGLQRQLQRGGFVVPNDLDERDVVLLRYRAGQYQGTSVGLTIVPTLTCNLACKYCFESCFRGTMTQETQEAVARFAGTLLPERGGALGVTWYGGEPLLALEVIAELSVKLQAVCNERQARYDAGIITNGTLLTREVARRLRELHVSSAQVTLDGPPEVHDARRPYRSGGGSFSRIVQNLAQVVAELPVSLRINVDRNNAVEVLSFVDWLVNQDWFDSERLTVHLGYVRKYTPACGCALEEMLKPTEFFELTEKLAGALVERGLFQPPYPDLATGCTATSARSFVVGPEGELYRCWNHVGDPQMRVGTVFEDLKPHPLYLGYLFAGFEADDECMQCKFLPLCAGGCVDVRIKAAKGLLPGKDCSGWRYYLERQLASYYRWWWQERQKETAHEA